MSNQLVLKNQYGEESVNQILPGGTSYLAGFQLGSNVILFSGATAPVDGTTGDNVAAKGSLYVAIDSGALYQNSGTITSPVWVIVDTGSSALATVIVGYVSGAGSISAADTILQAINKLNGNQVLSKATADAALPSASFTAAAVTGKALTGFSAGAGTLSASDTILEGFNKLAGNVAAHQADSVAGDVAALVADFNALLAKLQAAHLMA